MAIRIEKRITGYSVQSVEDKAREAAAAASVAPVITNAPEAAVVAAEPRMAEVVQMHERLERPERLEGSTYKIKSPLFEHALYVTLNDILLNPDTPHEHRRPFEIFVNSKNMEHFQWAVALTRVMSAVFRKGGDVTFIVEELKAVFDPRGGYYKSGGVYMPSVVAELGYVIEDHLKFIGMIKTDPPITLDTRSASVKPVVVAATPASSKSSTEGGRAPANAQLCPKCHSNSFVVMDGCQTCLSCGYSKCG
jgi:hypothetical protein